MALPHRNSSKPIIGRFTSRPIVDQQRRDEWHDDPHEQSTALARWIEQLNHSTLPFSMERLAQRPDYGELIWQMRLDGWDQRKRALKRLGGVMTTPDPRAQSAWSSRQILAAVCRNLQDWQGRSMPIWAISNEHANGLGALRNQLAELHHIPNLYAWIQTWPDGQIPYLGYDLLARRYLWQVEGQWRRIRIATLQAAMCLARLIHDWGYYLSPANPGDTIFAPRPHMDRASEVPVHTFMKALLALGDDCPQDFGCECNQVNWYIRAAAAAAAHRALGDQANTDMLPPHEEHHQQQHASQQEPPAAHAPRRSAPSTPVFPQLPDGDDDWQDDGVPDETGEHESRGWSTGV